MDAGKMTNSHVKPPGARAMSTTRKSKSPEERSAKRSRLETCQAPEDEENSYTSSNDETASPASGGGKTASEVASSTSGRWTKAEHEAFLVGLKLYGREWKKVATKIKTRTSAQIRSHAQKYFAKVAKERALEDTDGQGGDQWLLTAVETTLAALRERQQSLLQTKTAEPDTSGGGESGSESGDTSAGMSSGGGGSRDAAFTPSDFGDQRRHKRRSSSPPMSIDMLEDNELVALQVLCSNSAGRRDALHAGRDRKAMSSPVVRLGGEGGGLGGAVGRKRPYASASPPPAPTFSESAGDAESSSSGATDADARPHAMGGAPTGLPPPATDGSGEAASSPPQPAAKMMRIATDGGAPSAAELPSPPSVLLPSQPALAPAPNQNPDAAAAALWGAAEELIPAAVAAAPSPAATLT